jgi:peptide/nickel transport system permease protein
MRSYLLRRALGIVPLLFGILTLNFFIIRSAPGDPADIFDNPDLPPEYRQMMRKNYGLDDPLPVAYVKYLKAVAFHFDLGYSIAKKRPVAEEIKDALPNTLQLSALALILELIIGIAIGILAAVRQYSWFDGVTRVSALTLYSMPAFYLGLILLFLFAGGVWHWLPASGMYDIVRYGDMNAAEKLWSRLTHILLPTITLGLGSAASVSRYMRGQMLEVIRQDYIRTARSKGLPESAVIFRHGLRNALMPVVTLIGLSLPFLLSGAVVTENVFAWPGMGRVAVDAAFQRDYPMFLAVNVIFAAMVILGNLLSDVLYALVDPRVRLD